MTPTSHRQPTTPAPPPGRRVDESMTLLTSMMERPLDPGYAAASEERERAGLPPSTGFRTPTVLVAALVCGLLLTTGGLALRKPSTSAAKAKAALVAQVETRRAEVDHQAATLRALEAQVNRLQSQALGDVQSSLQTRLDSLALASGSVAVTGPGVRLVLDDAAGSGTNPGAGNPRTDTATDDGKVLSKDLQIVVNGLWQAGAEAVDINGQRLTSRSAIRFAGEAILVNYRPLVRPYTISAIGNSSSLQAQFAENDGGAYARALKDNYGIRVSIDGVARLTLPPATPATLRSATVPPRAPPSTTSPAPTTPERSP